MKKLIFLFCLIGFTYNLSAQIPVDTIPGNKNVLLEEYTGVSCTACPQGHLEIDNLVTAYPNKVFVAGMHSASVGHTTPYGNDEDLSRPFPDLLRYKINNLFGIPGGIISRRAGISGTEFFIFNAYPTYHLPIDSAINKIINESSPFNIGIEANYDTVNKTLVVNSQIYSSAATTSKYNINVFLTQSNILVSQLDGNTVIPNYNQKHVFREVLTPSWGTTIYTAGAAKGSIYNHSVTFNNSTRNYKMQDVEVLVFITDRTVTTNEKGIIVQVKGINVNLTGNTTGINELAQTQEVSVYPNPSEDIINIHISNPSKNNEIYVHDISGKLVLQKEIGLDNNNIINHQLAPGMYFISVKNNPDVVQKLIVK